MPVQPKVFCTFAGEALDVRQTPYGSVGTLFSGEGVEAVWVCKADEAIDPGWFSQGSVDLIVVVQGGLRVEYEQREWAEQLLGPGDVLVLPANVRCRAYRYPREQREATIFVALYPNPSPQVRPPSHS